MIAEGLRRTVLIYPTSSFMSKYPGESGPADGGSAPAFFLKPPCPAPVQPGRPRPQAAPVPSPSDPASSLASRAAAFSDFSPSDWYSSGLRWSTCSASITSQPS